VFDTTLRDPIGPDSIQLDVLKRLTTHLQGITPTAGYEFDMSESVFRGRLTFGDADPDPLISIVEHPTMDVATEGAAENSILREETWVLLVQGWLKNISNEYPTDDAYQLKAAAEHRLARCIEMNPATGDPMYPSEYFLGLRRGTITHMTIGPGMVSQSLRPESSARAFFYLPVGIGLVTNISKPFVGG
jgi:hypothetical protein